MPTRFAIRFARAALLLSALVAHAADPGDALRLTARLDKASYVSGGEMSLVVTLTNAGAGLLPVLRADSLGADFLRFDVLDPAGRLVPPHVKRTPIPRFDDPVALAPGDSVESTFDLHDNYPLGLPPGDYTLAVSYDCSPMRYPEKSADVVDLSAEAPGVRFHVEPRSPAQERQCDALRAALRAVDDAACIRIAREGLALDESGPFARRLRIELAAALWRSGERAAAAELYTLVADDDSATPATRRLARFNLGLIYHELGERDAAVAMMRQVESRAARHYADDWSARRDGRPAEGG